MTSIRNSPIVNLGLHSAGWPLSLTGINCLCDLGYVLSSVLSIYLSTYLPTYCLFVHLFACNGTAQAAWIYKLYFLGFLFRLCDLSP